MTALPTVPLEGVRDNAPSGVPFVAAESGAGSPGSDRASEETAEARERREFMTSLAVLIVPGLARALATWEKAR